MDNQTLWLVILISCGSLVVFLIFREIICIYFKINERLQMQKDMLQLQKDGLSLQKDILETLKQINKAIP